MWRRAGIGVNLHRDRPVCMPHDSDDDAWVVIQESVNFEECTADCAHVTRCPDNDEDRRWLGRNGPARADAAWPEFEDEFAGASRLSARGQRAGPSGRWIAAACRASAR